MAPLPGGGNNNPCRRFQANMFSKVRCQHCFKPREGHSDEALENGKVSENSKKSSYHACLHRPALAVDGRLNVDARRLMC